MRLIRVLLLFVLSVSAATSVQAEYIVLLSGQRIHVTGYQVLGNKYHLQMMGGSVDVPVDQVTAIDPEDAFASLPPTQNSTAPYREIIQSAATRYSIDADLISSVIAVESNFDPKSISKRNARGLMQLLPETAARLGVQNIFDPKENIDAGTHYLSDLLKRYNNDLVLALAAYNAGPERVEQYGRVPPYTETISYVRRVKRNYEKNKSATPAQSTPAANADPGSKKPQTAEKPAKSPAQQP